MIKINPSYKFNDYSKFINPKEICKIKYKYVHLLICGFSNQIDQYSVIMESKIL